MSPRELVEWGIRTGLVSRAAPPMPEELKYKEAIRIRVEGLMRYWKKRRAGAGLGTATRKHIHKPLIKKANEKI